ncbi:hypothetical protein BC936DRAFT_137044 [Jimgerdemannia flammicorona]|uniref:Uncharacterized protein n=2 Tax=Jimgerdemannia flammicorona TaxID=994334 RepID=A0A433QHN4_9FUNG|nr:hypothetical protein BC936DRAFT_137044 [Jimgerdemannia flammicorona]RUS29264.1 hypothetical protein BC938DRAFT_480863 [Jimgerdemannia flammicorona]
MSNSPRQDSRKPQGANRSRTDSNSSSPTGQASPKLPTVNPGPPLPRAQEHVSVNNFNRREVTEFLNHGYSTVFATLHEPSVPEHEKPELYKSAERAWASKGGLPSVWGQKGSTMASGVDFLAELRKQVQRSPSTGTLPTGAPAPIPPGGVGRQG